MTEDELFWERAKNTPRELVIDFSKVEEINITAKEIYKCVLKGKIDGKHKIEHGNIILSRMEAMEVSSTDFAYVDFKDSNIIRTSFDRTSFDYGAIINCNIEETRFHSCHFQNVSITNTVFNQTVFEECDLSNMVIETCRFYNCQFLNCTTSNKLIESSLFHNTTFLKTDIQLQTITENFGLTANDISLSGIRNLSIREDFKYVDKDFLERMLLTGEVNSIEKFKLEYFLDPSVLIEGSEFIDSTFKLEEWLKLVEIPATFINLLRYYHQFLTMKYEEGESPFYPLIKLHSLTASITNNIQVNFDVYNQIMGIHMGLAREMEKFLDVTFQTLENTEHPLRFLVEGPVQKDYYANEFQFMFENTSSAVADVKLRNSPSELFISWETIKDIIPIISVFIATRVKIQFENLRKAIKVDSENTLILTGPIQIDKRSLRKVQFELGMDEKNQYLYGLKLKTIFPGDLMMDLRLHVSTKLLGKVRKILVDLLSK